MDQLVRTTVRCRHLLNNPRLLGNSQRLRGYGRGFTVGISERYHKLNLLPTKRHKRLKYLVARRVPAKKGPGNGVAWHA